MRIELPTYTTETIEADGLALLDTTKYELRTPRTRKLGSSDEYHGENIQKKTSMMNVSRLTLENVHFQLIRWAVTCTKVSFARVLHTHFASSRLVAR